MERACRLLRSLPRDAQVIEIGPSYNPLTPKRDGWNTFIVDHASQEELRVKYADQDVDRIEPVDAVWRGGSLIDAIPAERHGTFDAFIASHVIEHTPDIIAFLRAAQTLVKLDGIVILALPDKRKCFDFYRYPSATSEAIAAFLDRRDRHSVRTQIDYAINMALKDGVYGVWSGQDTRPTTLSHAIEIEGFARHNAGLPDYTDAHGWVFVPSSFQLMLEELALLGYVDLRVDDIAEAEATEFYVWLRRGRDVRDPEDARARRKLLMDRTIVELAEQALQIQDARAETPLPAVELSHRVERDCIAAVRILTEAVRESLGWRGLDRRRFQCLIAEASRALPDGPGSAAQHRVLLVGSARVLGLAQP